MKHSTSSKFLSYLTIFFTIGIIYLYFCKNIINIAFILTTINTYTITLFSLENDKVIYLTKKNIIQGQKLININIYDKISKLNNKFNKDSGFF
jgi:uncharacterized membrane protein (Fun14 family)